MAAPLRKLCEATEAAQTGWSDRHLRDFAELTTPARQLLLSCRATPPLRGGEFVNSIFKRNTNEASPQTKKHVYFDDSKT